MPPTRKARSPSPAAKRAYAKKGAHEKGRADTATPTVPPEAGGTKKEARPLWKRPPYFSDADSRPHCRGAWYAAIRETGAAWLVLGAYALSAGVSLVRSGGVRWPLQLCRLVHTALLVLNVVLSDGLHNLDRHLGAEYVRKASVVEREKTLHARDWRAALGVPASYHVLLIFGIMDPVRVASPDVGLLALNLGCCLLMCMRIHPSLITPERPLFLSFVLTFAAQMVLLLVAFWREREHHALWLPLWCVYAVGLVAKALEWPDSKYFGHHEMLHASCIIGHFAGLVIDLQTT